MILVTGRLRGLLAWLKMDPNFFTALARERSCLLGTPGSCNTCDSRSCAVKNQGYNTQQKNSTCDRRTGGVAVWTMLQHTKDEVGAHAKACFTLNQPIFLATEQTCSGNSCRCVTHSKEQWVLCPAAPCSRGLCNMCSEMTCSTFCQGAVTSLGTAQHSAAQRSAAQHSRARHSPAQPSSAQPSPSQHQNIETSNGRGLALLHSHC